MIGSYYDIQQDYFHWLCEMVHIEQEERSYWILAKDLHRKVFYPIIEHDENRALDGLELREQYMSDKSYVKYLDMPDECSVLEMLIGLAQRMDFETSDPLEENYQDKTSYWFWEMIDNLGLIAFDDESYVDLEGQTYVDSIIDEFIERRYSPNGDGGLFPLRRSRNDQRNVEIWYQMSAYLTENEAV